MSVFRKKSAVPEEQALLAAMDDMRERPKHEPGIEDATGEPSPAPSDDLDHASDGDEEAGVPSPFLDFGSIQVPAVDGMQVRAELDGDDVVAVTVVLDDTLLQLQAFAAPRSESLWDEVRQDIAEGIRGGQGKAREADGPFGRELQAVVVVVDPSGATTSQEARFIGRDGDRWFLRGVVTGAGIADADRADAVHRVFAEVVVIRGGQAAAPRDPLPLHLPDDARMSTEQGSDR